MYENPDEIGNYTPDKEYNESKLCEYERRIESLEKDIKEIKVKYGVCRYFKVGYDFAYYGEDRKYSLTGDIIIEQRGDGPDASLDKIKNEIMRKRPGYSFLDIRWCRPIVLEKEILVI